MPHFAKTPEGAVLEFAFVEHPESLLAAFESALAAAADLPPKDRMRAERALDGTRRWPRVGKAPVLSEVSSRRIVLTLPASTAARSSPSLAVDGVQAALHFQWASDFHADRPFLNALSKARGWAGPDGAPLAFAPLFSHALSIGRGMRMDDLLDGNMLGSQPAFALFSPASGGYFEVINASSWSTRAPISRAKLFESAKEARSFSSRKKMRQSLSIIEVSVRAVRAVELAADCDHGPLLRAIARAEAAELDVLLRDKETERLRERVAVLESERLDGAPPKAERSKRL